MATSSSAIPARAVSITQTPSDDSSYTTTAKSATSTLPSAVAQSMPAPSPLELPPSSPNLPSPPLQPPPTPPISAHMTPACSIATTPNSISPIPSAHSHSATVPAPAPSPRALKLQSQISTLQSQIANTQRSLDDTLAKLQDQISSTAAVPQLQCLSGPAQNGQDLLAHAEAIVKRHIKLLHAYNEIKDVGQGLMGLIADARGVRLKEVMEEMGIGEKD